MKNHPRDFLFDLACPQDALGEIDAMHLHENTYEYDALTKAKENASLGPDEQKDTSSGQNPSFHCKAVLVSGRNASEKSSLLSSLSHSCNQDGWFVINCNFNLGEHTAPQAMSAALDEFFARWVPGDGQNLSDTDLNSSLTKSFRQVCKSSVYYYFSG